MKTKSKIRLAWIRLHLPIYNQNQYRMSSNMVMKPAETMGNTVGNYYFRNKKEASESFNDDPDKWQTWWDLHKDDFTLPQG